MVLQHDQEEEEDAAGSTAAESLGLWPDAGGKHRLMLVQLPDVLPQLLQPQQQGKGASAGTKSRSAASSLRQLGDGKVCWNCVLSFEVSIHVEVL